MHSRPLTLALLAPLVATLVATPGASAGSASTEEPLGDANVLFITIDDLSTDLSIYGNREVVSPHFERLAMKGMRFDRAYTQFATCNPSRTSMLTGLRPGTTGVLDNKINFRTLLPDVVTLPQLFRQNGYFTMNIGKTFHGVGDKAWDDAAAWDLSITPGGRKNWRAGEGRNVTRGKIAWASWVASIRPDAYHPDGRIAQAAVDALEQLHASSQPFFLAVGFHRPHAPFIAPEPYFDLYDLDQLELRNPPETYSKDPPGTTGRRASRIFRRMKEQDRRELLRAYYACVSFADRQLGRLLDTLDRIDGWEDTIVIVTSDHGVHLGEHEWWAKDTLFEPSTHVPLIIYSPGVRMRRQRTRRLVELVDLYPTIVDLADLAPPDHLEGRSLEPLLRQPGRPWTPASFSQLKREGHEGSSLRTKRFRYTQWNGTDRRVELYDHANDPEEYSNLAGVPEFGALEDQLEELLRTVFPDE